MKKITAVDLFCGAGGESTGLKMAADSLGKELELLAINHWDVAIKTHSRNHVYAKHMCENIQSVDPLQAVPSGRLNLLWASPECTFYSNARGGRPQSDQSRASAWLILKWLSELYVERVIIENVPEFKNWGPLGVDKKPLKSKKGDTFRTFIKALEAIGYKVEYKILCAADYGDPTTRKRLFIQAVRGNRKITWPLESHGEPGLMFPEKNWKPAKDIIDWSLTGQSIFTRKKPLSANTIARIEAGIEKYWGEWAEPFLIVLRGTRPNSLKNTALPVTSPLPTVTTSGSHFGLIEPFLVQMNGSKQHQLKSSAIDLKRPVPTITAGGLGKMGLIEPFIISSGHTSSIRIRSMKEPLRTVVTKAEHGIVQSFIIPYYGTSGPADIDRPLQSVTTKNRFALIEGNTYTLDIRYRMLQPHELAAAHSFPTDYDFSGNKTEIVKQIGNSVPVHLAKALCIASLRGVA